MLTQNKAKWKTKLGDRRELHQKFARGGFSENYYTFFLLVLVILIEGAVVLLVIRDLHSSYVEIDRVHERSVGGLRQIGDLQYYAQETHLRTLYALTTNDANLQVNYADQARAADRRVTEGIENFQMHPRSSQVLAVGQKLRSDWADYLGVRDQVLALILEGRTDRAVELDVSSGIPRFDRVRQDLKEMKGIYDDQASERLDEVSRLSRRSMIRLSTALAFGLLFGGIAVWAIERNTVRARLQLASLQMDIVASVSHELRTPVTAILSAGENFRDGLVRGEQSLTDHGSIIAGQAERLMKLVDQVLLYVSTTKDGPRREARPISVYQIIDDALRDTSILLAEHGFTVTREVQPGLPPVLGDLAVFSQCLQNLITNAIKYSGGSHWLGILAQLAFGSGSRDAEIRISVHDYGIGIDAADLPHVFEPFYRSPRAMRTQMHGTGLGLSIAKRSVEAFGGSLSVVSDKATGTVFTLHLCPAEDGVASSEDEAEKVRVDA